ncbi:MAG: DUF4264 family protein [bacterium]|jgi:hypothetical protein
MDLWANHKSLPLIAEEAFRLPEDVHRLITLLNQTLKRHGFVFGLRRRGDSYTFSIYATDAWKDSSE